MCTEPEVKEELVTCEEQKEGQCVQGTCEKVGDGRDRIGQGRAVVESLNFMLYAKERL